MRSGAAGCTWRQARGRAGGRGKRARDAGVGSLASRAAFPGAVHCSSVRPPLCLPAGGASAQASSRRWHHAPCARAGLREEVNECLRRYAEVAPLALGAEEDEFLYGR